MKNIIILKISNIFRFGELNPSNQKIGLYYGEKVSRRTNSLFIHIPKAAGISFQYGLYNKESSGHISIKSFLNYLGEETFNKVYKFTIVRNPYQRLISAYIYLRKGGRFAKNDLEYQKIIGEYENFEDFVLNFFQTNQYLDMEHFIPQTNWLVDDNGILRVDYIGYFENIDTEFIKINKQIYGEHSKRVLAKKNITKTPNNLKYNTSMLKIINKVYHKDFELLNYEIQK